MQVYLQESVCRACLGNHPSRSLYTSRMCRQTHYEVLGVGANSSTEQIKAAFFRLSKQLHPDCNPSDPELHGRFVRLNEAYTVLSKPDMRRQYDVGLHLSQARTSQPGARAPESWTFTSPGFTEKQKYAQSARWEHDRMYWEQFHYPDPKSSTFVQSTKYRWRGRLIMGSCIIFMGLSIVLHYLGYRMLGELHSHYMDERDRTNAKIYETSKENAHMNGVEKQNEILRRKYTEFVTKYRKEQKVE